MSKSFETVFVRIRQFNARLGDELTLKVGDKIEVLADDSEYNDGWYMGRKFSPTIRLACSQNPSLELLNPIHPTHLFYARAPPVTKCPKSKKNDIKQQSRDTENDPNAVSKSHPIYGPSHKRTR